DESEAAALGGETRGGDHMQMSLADEAKEGGDRRRREKEEGKKNSNNKRGQATLDGLFFTPETRKKAKT
ncbi:MAG: hypothetical protein Q9163_002164, partial [Psora crenata]